MQNWVRTCQHIDGTPCISSLWYTLYRLIIMSFRGSWNSTLQIRKITSTIIFIVHFCQLYLFYLNEKIRYGWNFLTFSLSSFVRSLWRNNFGLTWNLFFSKTSSTFWHISRLASLRDGELRSNRRQPCSFLNWYMVDSIWQSGPSGVKSKKWRIWRQ